MKKERVWARRPGERGKKRELKEEEKRERTWSTQQGYKKLGEESPQAGEV